MTTSKTTDILKLKPTIVGANNDNQLPQKDFTISLAASNNDTYKSVRFIVKINEQQLEPGSPIALTQNKPTEQLIKFQGKDIGLDDKVIIEPRFFKSAGGTGDFQKGTDSDVYTFNAKQLD
jgi:hypothetical protein